MVNKLGRAPPFKKKVVKDIRVMRNTRRRKEKEKVRGGVKAIIPEAFATMDKGWAIKGMFVRRLRDTKNVGHICHSFREAWIVGRGESGLSLEGTLTAFQSPAIMWRGTHGRDSSP